MTWRWDDSYKGAAAHYTWYDLLDKDDLLGYVRKSVGANVFMANINETPQVRATFDNLEEAKGFIVAHYVALKLES